MNIKWIVVLILVVLVIIILIQNREVVTFRLLFWKVALSQVILVPLVLIIGFLTGYFVRAVTISRGEKPKGD